MPEERQMTEELYNKILEAQSTLCSYCENDECGKCIVTALVDDAHLEAEEAGIIEDA